MAAFSIHLDSALARFWRDEGHAPVQLAGWAKLGLALIVLNEIRGVAVVASVARAYFG